MGIHYVHLEEYRLTQREILYVIVSDIGERWDKYESNIEEIQEIH